MSPQPFVSEVQNHCFRLKPDQDLKEELLAYAQKHQLQAALILSSVGSLTKARIRLANGKDTVEFTGPFEIVSLTGTVSTEGIHMHISLSDTEGKVRGGHLMEGSLIHTTCEVILQENLNLIFKREPDPTTTYKELKITPR